MKMPEKDPINWQALAALLQDAAAYLSAPAMSAAIAVLRVIYTGGSRRQMALEGALCGLITVSVKPLVVWLGLPDGMATFVGACVGFIGVEELRLLAVKFGQRKAGGQ